jgi:hypothetical protein
VRPSGWCWFHDPTFAAERDAGRRKGGVQRSNQARARKQFTDGGLTPQELSGLLGKALQDVLDGKVEPGPVNAAANIARALLAVREATETEERLTALEARAGLTRKDTA